MQFVYNFSRKNTDERITNVGTHDTSEIHWTTGKCQSKSTQTDYRDSETQTMPWEPPYKLPLGCKPEILALTGLRWNDREPIGMYEIKIVKRLRVKKAWESVLPPLDSDLHAQVHNAIIAMIDKAQWASREKELQLSMDSRMERINKTIKLNNFQKKRKALERLEKIGKNLSQVRNKEVNKIKRDFSRDLRKLSSNWSGGGNSNLFKNTRPTKLPVMKQELQFGKAKMNDKDFYGELLRKTPIDAREMTKIRVLKMNGKSGEICPRETRWTEDKLRELHSDLRNVRLNVK